MLLNVYQRHTSSNDASRQLHVASNQQSCLSLVPATSTSCQAGRVSSGLLVPSHWCHPTYLFTTTAAAR
jgi:hypothetical protein